jgi:hypothetical protein
MSKQHTENSENMHMPHVDWTSNHENILVEWADKAMCYRWLHGRAHQHFSKANMWFTIPVIIMSTLTGTANFAQDKFSGSTKEYVVVAIGAVNILAGIITTIQQFLKISELNEAHRVSSLSWDKFYRNIKVDLAKSPKERTPVIQMLKSSKEEFDRLMEISPAISNKITKEFKKEFSFSTSKMPKVTEVLEEELQKTQLSFTILKKPEICGMLESSAGCVYKPDKNVVNNMNIIVNAQHNIEEKTKIDKIEQIITTFKTQRNRPPTTDEILDELDNEVTIEMITTTQKNLINNENNV